MIPRGLLFKHPKLRQQYPKLDFRVRLGAELWALWLASERPLVVPIVTDIYRDDPSSLHHYYNAIDLAARYRRGRRLPAARAAKLYEQFAVWANERFAYRRGSRIYVAVSGRFDKKDKHGDHIHWQASLPHRRNGRILTTETIGPLRKNWRT
jgi:hypothetical protein